MALELLRCSGVKQTNNTKIGEVEEEEEGGGEERRGRIEVVLNRVHLCHAIDLADVAKLQDFQREKCKAFWHAKKSMR